MNTTEEHPHNFAFCEWPFAEATNTAALTTTRVAREGYPILLVCHDHDGDWQLLCGTTNDTADGLVVCLGCMFGSDRSIGGLADLPIGWRAWRESADAPWHRAAYAPSGLMPTLTGHSHALVSLFRIVSMQNCKPVLRMCDVSNIMSQV